ncbi:heme biosynthesis HemY N-terminal domain-containing protein [Curvibacter sp. APW13]|uniref:heme biosynthesis HemY N-terminal domain-containing protein n=1 Tax=Curvibacter sp. APW13 TaxID=3077236 RepID=UPI0028DE7DFC|nr:heme biosynthesis HemY N-terminal domain-containing protein [Curvibacter sp. APW13]MDT8990911.1 heme biosynthesis HemY N-terminal domain-containing protein [Curvibacter sp. APW13]
MRAVLWLLGLFAVAVVAALFAGNNHDSVTLFWEPYRVDLSFNLAVVLVAGLFVVLHTAFNAVSALLNIPQQARRWRLSQRERAMYAALLDALTLLVCGRFVRARKAAERVLEMDEALGRGGEKLPFGTRLRAMAHLIAAESAHAVQDRSARENHLGRALQASQTREGQELLDGVRLRGARWAFDDRQAEQALEQLNQLPLGTSRRTLALRLRFKAARLAGDARLALDTARLLTKHRAFSELAGASIARGLAIEALGATHDPVQVQRVWAGLDPAEQAMPDVALFAARRLAQSGGSAAMAQSWLMPVWSAATGVGTARLNDAQRVQLVAVMETLFAKEDAALDTEWLRRIEQAQAAHPADALWNYLAGVACMRMQLWGKAQQLLKQSVGGLRDADMRRRAWQHLGAMAEERQDMAAALTAYREAAKT